MLAICLSIGGVSKDICLAPQNPPIIGEKAPQKRLPCGNGMPSPVRGSTAAPERAGRGTETQAPQSTRESGQGNRHRRPKAVCGKRGQPVPSCHAKSLQGGIDGTAPAGSAVRVCIDQPHVSWHCTRHRRLMFMRCDVAHLARATFTSPRGSGTAAWWHGSTAARQHGSTGLPIA